MMQNVLGKNRKYEAEQKTEKANASSPRRDHY